MWFSGPITKMIIQVISVKSFIKIMNVSVRLEVEIICNNVAVYISRALLLLSFPLPKILPESLLQLDGDLESDGSQVKRR